MPDTRLPSVTLQNVPIIFKNFQGQKGQYNAEGVRTFSIVIETPTMAEEMLKDGWNLKPLKDEDGKISAYHLPVKVNFASRRPPRIYKVTQGGTRQLQLNEEMVGMLDYLTVSTVDVIINPYAWDVNGNQGIKAYLDTMYANIDENELDLKYAQLKDGPIPFDEE